MSYTCKITVGDMGQNYDSAIARLKALGVEADGINPSKTVRMREKSLSAAMATILSSQPMNVGAQMHCMHARIR